ncbi:hypothetical protein AQJ11_02935 [Streptomyces corchorusii]|uniref:Uncharacterized protein n=2 Tax=Streptomyces TaxID=1883 RepID=A0A101QM69_STRCK|nr:hypothetical protein [Streptomyces corchorusii]KUN32497.1 hypothetical protein AQJ11_02935 [Streptomyces corchorusii]
MSAYLASARRLMALATVVRGRAYHPQRYMIETLAGAIEDAAIALQTCPVDEPGQIPQPAADAVREATDLLTQHDFMIPAAILGYATSPITGTVPSMQPLTAVSLQLARQDIDLRARRLAIVEHGHLNSRDDEVLGAALAGLMVLHRKHERLAAAVAADNERPCNRGKAPAYRAH